ncbi:MAG: hypothetical protein HUJ26_17500 [Planctomycetaceae bacterium]|nr:hypothetical protein [Planctomycetaceae bacterium]
MDMFSYLRITALTCLVSLAVTANAQVAQVGVNAISPPGAQRGKTIDVTISSGKDLDMPQALVFSHPGITSKYKTGNTFEVTIGENVPVGFHDVRLHGYFGISNPRTFVVSDSPEILENDDNNTLEKAQPVDLGTIVNGASNRAADVDFYKLNLPADYRLVAEVEAQVIDSRMQAQIELLDVNGRRIERSRGGYRGDPVLDHTVKQAGEYFLKVTEFSYRGSNDYFYRLHVNSRPHIDFLVPPSGQPGSTSDYTVYGRNLPGGVPAGVQLDGVELQKISASITLPANPEEHQLQHNLQPEESSADVMGWRLPSEQGTSNALSIHYADAPVILEQEPNNEPAQAQKITLPAEIGGQFQEKLDADWYEFTAKQGDVYAIEAFGQRLGKQTDPRFIVEQVTVNDKGEESVKRLTDQDDQTSSIGGDDFNTRHRDPAWMMTVPADGLYRIMISDRYRENRGDASLQYRLVIRPQSPDFRLVAFASTPNPAANQPGTPGVLALRKGDNGYIDLLAHRKDGFDGIIDIKVEGLPAGVTCPGAVIGPGQSSSRLILTAAPDAAVAAAPIRIIGESRLEDSQLQKDLKAAIAAIKPAEDKLPALEKAVADAMAKIEPAQKKVDAEGEAAKAELKKVQDALKTTQDNLATGQKAVADAKQKVQTLQQQLDQTAKPITHRARTASLIWTGNQNTGENTDARLTRSLMVSVMDDLAEFQAVVTAPTPRVEVSQSSQVLVPVKVERREGFDNNVNLTFAGFDARSSKLQVENKPLNKGENEGVRRVFVPKDAPPGAYTLYLTSQAQVSYERNSLAIAEAKAAVDKAEAERKAKEEANKTATEAAKKADADLKTAEAKLKTATDALANAQKARQASQVAVTAQQKKVQEAEATLKTRNEELKKAQEALAKAKADADADKENQDKANAVKVAEEQVQTATKNQQEAANAIKAEQQKLTQAEADLKAKTEAVTKAETEKKSAETAVASAKETKTKADETAKTADAAFKAATTAKTNADKNLQNVTNANKAKNVNLTVPSTPVVLIVKEAPFELTVAPPDGGNLKKGAAIEVPVTIKRIPRFDGPVTVTLPLLPGVAGLRADPLTIPADQTQGVLKIHADENAPDGKPANLVIRGEAEFLGKASVDAPLSLNLTK